MQAVGRLRGRCSQDVVQRLVSWAVHFMTTMHYMHWVSNVTIFKLNSSQAKFENYRDLKLMKHDMSRHTPNSYTVLYFCVSFIMILWYVEHLWHVNYLNLNLVHNLLRNDLTKHTSKHWLQHWSVPNIFSRYNAWSVKLWRLKLAGHVTLL